MNSLRIAALLDAIRRGELLRDADMRTVEQWFLSPDVDIQASANEIVARRWLTAMQLKMYWQGRGEELYLNQYVLMDKIGEGGMGEVYRAWHRPMDRIVALKLIRPERLDNPDAIGRFRREIQAAASLSHENVVMAYDADEADGRNFFVMEYVDGRNLWDIVQSSGRLSVRRACDLIRQAALGLQHAHERGMVHRDIKPNNLLVNGVQSLKILDMGLARRTTPSANAETVDQLTRDGMAVGTPDFIAPEQARDASSADIRADIYSLGATLYYLLTAQPPFPGGSATEKMLRHSVDPIPDPSRLRPDIPPYLAAIVAKMMAKSPKDRFEIPMQVAEKLAVFSIDPAAAASGILRRAPRAEEPLSDFTDPFVAVPAPKHRSQGQSTTEIPNVPADLAPPRPAAQAPAPGPLRGGDTFGFDTDLPPTIQEWVRPSGPMNSFLLPLVGGTVVLLLVGVGLFFAGGSGDKKKAESALAPSLKFRANIRVMLIPPGKFLMGSPDDETGRSPNEGPRHEVEIASAFYMGQTEVTQNQYATVVGRTPFEFRNQREAKDLPAEKVSWRDATAMCDKLNGDPESTRPKGMVWRLPTEAEWEYACRAGSNTPYAGGSVLSPESFAYADSVLLSPRKANPAAVNAFKLTEMHGNVWEWCSDIYAPEWYATSPGKNPTGPKNGKQRVLRGGAWNVSDNECRSAYRRGESMDVADGSVGFRLVLGPETVEK